MRRKSVLALEFLLLGMALMFGLGCPSSWQQPLANSTKPKIEPRIQETRISFSLPDQKNVTLGAEIWGPPGNISSVTPKTVVIFVPGSGTVSRYARQTGDGIVTYTSPASVNVEWATALAGAGYWSLLYDKRNCGPANEDICQNNPMMDFNEQGPKALARDVDAACAAARSELGSGVRIVLWTSEQGTQVVLSSKCAEQASAFVFVAPIPYRIDTFWVEGLFQAGLVAREPMVRSALVQKARNLQATFDSIQTGQFAPEANVMGVPLSFWKEWILLTKQSDFLLLKIRQPILFLVGQEDGFYNERARNVLKKQGSGPQRQFLRLPLADHNLLMDGSLRQETQDTVFSALARYLKRD